MDDILPFWESVEADAEDTDRDESETGRRPPEIIEKGVFMAIPSENGNKFYVSCFPNLIECDYICGIRPHRKISGIGVSRPCFFLL